MNIKQWDKDIAAGIVNEEMKQHMGNLFILSDGRIGVEYDPDIRVNLMSGKIEGRKRKND